MADSTIDSELIMLNENWPGKASRDDEPAGNIVATAHHNVAAAVYSTGQKVALRNESAGQPGWSTFIYLQVGTQNASSVLAVKSAVVPDSATLWYQVTNDPDDCIKLPTNMGAFALSAMTNAYWGWFWCGGVCPEEYVSGLGGNYATAGTLAAGGFLFHNLVSDYVGLDAVSAVNETQAGFALAADA